MHQKTNTTKYDRYPLIFETVSKYFEGFQPRILSYGCSTGEEVRTLKEIYFPDSEIHGVDKKPVIESINIDIPDCKFFSAIPQYRYDVIFAMSVLCRWEDTKDKENINNIYPYSRFNKQVIKFDRHLSRGGMLVIYNANFRFCDTEISKNYSIFASNKIVESGFVHKFNSENNRIEETYKDVIFIKK